MGFLRPLHPADSCFTNILNTARIGHDAIASVTEESQLTAYRFSRISHSEFILPACRSYWNISLYRHFLDLFEHTMNRTFVSKEDSMDSDSEHNELEQDGLLRSRKKKRGYSIQSRWRPTAKALTLLNACFATLFIFLSISSWRNKNCLPGAPPPWCKNIFQYLRLGWHILTTTRLFSSSTRGRRSSVYQHKVQTREDIPV